MKHVSPLMIDRLLPRLILAGAMLAGAMLIGNVHAQTDLGPVAMGVNTLAPQLSPERDGAQVFSPALVTSLLSLLGIVLTGLIGVARETRLEGKESAKGEPGTN